MNKPIRILHIVGARPNFMKIAAVMAAMERCPAVFEQRLVHTGQHYSEGLSGIFFEDLQLPIPDVSLEVGSASHASQTARIMLAFEPVLEVHRPDAVIVVGDVNSTLACTLVASKMGVPVIHIEAGLRSYNREMPEEINRLVTDVLSSFLFTTDHFADENLAREGIEAKKIYRVGNVMVDTLLRFRERALALNTLSRFGLDRRRYALLTLHRPSNVDNRATLVGILEALVLISQKTPVVFPIHPRTRGRLEEFELWDRAVNVSQLQLVEPQSYLHFVNLMAHAGFVITDSGGIQEETTVLAVPCLTLRKETERPITVTEGTNTVVGTDPSNLIAESDRILDGASKKGRIPELWDGRAAERIVEILKNVVIAQ